MPNSEITLTDIKVTFTLPKTTRWRLVLCTMILRFAAWVGGFGGIEIETKGE